MQACLAAGAGVEWIEREHPADKIYNHPAWWQVIAWKQVGGAGWLVDDESLLEWQQAIHERLVSPEDPAQDMFFPTLHPLPIADETILAQAQQQPGDQPHQLFLFSP